MASLKNVRSHARRKAGQRQSLTLMGQPQQGAVRRSNRVASLSTGGGGNHESADLRILAATAYAANQTSTGFSIDVVAADAHPEKSDPMQREVRLRIDASTETLMAPKLCSRSANQPQSTSPAMSLQQPIRSTDRQILAVPVHTARKLEIVKVQRHAHRSETVESFLETEEWSTAQVTAERVDPATKVLYLRLRFDDGEELEVCAGAVLRPQQRQRQRVLASALGPIEALTRNSGVSRLQGSADSADDVDQHAHASSGDDFFSSDCSDSSGRSMPSEDYSDSGSADEGISIGEDASQHVGVEIDSDETMSDSAYIATGRPATNPRKAILRPGGARQKTAVQDGRSTSPGRGLPPSRQSRHLSSDGATHSHAGTSTTGGKRPLLERGKPTCAVEATHNSNLNVLPPETVNADLCGHNVSDGSSSDSWYRGARTAVPRRRRRKPTTSQVEQRQREVDIDEALQLRFGEDQWVPHVPLYRNAALSFTGPELGCSHPYGRLPTVKGIFQKFWPEKLQRRIVRESNLYASEIINEDGRTRGGPHWTPLSLAEFRAYLSITFFMGIKRFPNRRLYWSREESLYHCNVISGILTRDRFELITRCLHVAIAPPAVRDRRSPSYDKLHKVRWLVDDVRKNFQGLWRPNQQVTVDESMVMYKGKYSPIRQYMPRKPVRFGLKVWAASDAVSKYVLNFEIYTGKVLEVENDGSSSEDSDMDCQVVTEFPETQGPGAGLQGRHVVKRLLQELEGRGHIVTVDNFFTSVPLFLDLLDRGIMATGTVRVNRKYVPRSLFAKQVTKKKDYGWSDYRMHVEGSICCSVWKDRKAVVLLSTHAAPVPLAGSKPFVRRSIHGKRKKVRTTPMHLQYTQNMRGVDTSDQLRGVYSCLTRSHKWWHRLFMYLLDTSICNAWIIHSDLSFRFMEEPLTHLSFQMELAKQFIATWGGRTQSYSTVAPTEAAAHGTKSMGLKRANCFVCGRRTNQACPACEKHLCKGPCYWESHWSF